jgi:molybdate transport system substrate-binding protein
MMKRALGSCMTVLLLSGLAFVGCSKSNEPKPVVILAASSLSHALDSIAVEFEAAKGIPVRIAYGASGTLAEQIRSGVAADIFLSADARWLQELAAERSRVTKWRPLLTNRMVVVTRDGAEWSVGSLADLRDAKFRKIAIANPEVAPAGRYAVAALRSAGIYDAISDRLVPCENAAATANIVRIGLAEVGIVYATDALSYAGLKDIHTIEARFHPPIVYGMAVLHPRGGEPRAEAQAFAEYLNSPVAEQHFRASAYIVYGSHRVAGDDR